MRRCWTNSYFGSSCPPKCHWVTLWRKISGPGCWTLRERHTVDRWTHVTFKRRVTWFSTGPNFVDEKGPKTCKPQPKLNWRCAHVTCAVDATWMNDIFRYPHNEYFGRSSGKLYAIHSFNLKVLALALQVQERHHRLVFLSQWIRVWYNTKKPTLLPVNTCWSFQISTDFLGVV